MDTSSLPFSKLINAWNVSIAILFIFLSLTLVLIDKNSLKHLYRHEIITTSQKLKSRKYTEIPQQKLFSRQKILFQNVFQGLQRANSYILRSPIFGIVGLLASDYLNILNWSNLK